MLKDSRICLNKEENTEIKGLFYRFANIVILVKQDHLISEIKAKKNRLSEPVWERIIF